MSASSVNIVIGGAAGQGLATVGQMLTKSLIRGGYDVHVTQDYMSRVRGGHNTYRIRVGGQAPVDEVDILVALAEETVELFEGRVVHEGLIVVDEDMGCTAPGCVAVPYKDLVPKPIFENVAALGLLCALLGLDQAIPEKLVGEVFGKKGEAIVNQNVEVLEAGYAWCAAQDVSFAMPAPARDNAADPRLMLNGNEAIALGCMAGGVKLCSFYPMTPGTSVAQNLITHGAKVGVLVEQVEDEIAALNMAVGAAVGGARSMVTTSGGGLALMVEAVSMAGVMETPVVIVDAQRPGPATGLPTRTEQADLNLCLYAGHGEFPRPLFAPGDVEQCFELARHAFDVADRYQVPVFLLSDQYLADSFRSVAPFELDRVPARPFSEADLGPADSYQSYKITESGVSPRAVPGEGKHLIVADSHEHLENGHITEDPEVRVAMQDKRMRKECGMVAEAIAPELSGEPGADLLLVCWGSTKTAVFEAAERLRAEGKSVGALHFSQVAPLKAGDFLPLLEGAGKTVMVEGNATGQFAAYIRQTTGFAFDQLLLRYDGRPFSVNYILDRLEQ